MGGRGQAPYDGKCDVLHLRCKEPTVPGRLAGIVVRELEQRYERLNFARSLGVNITSGDVGTQGPR